jgi:hypothetical protein
VSDPVPGAPPPARPARVLVACRAGLAVRVMLARRHVLVRAAAGAGAMPTLGMRVRPRGHAVLGHVVSCLPVRALRVGRRLDSGPPGLYIMCI